MTTAWELIQRLRCYSPNTLVTIEGIIKPKLFVTCRDDEEYDGTIIVISENGSPEEQPPVEIYCSLFEKKKVKELREKLREFFEDMDVVIRDDYEDEYYIDGFTPMRGAVQIEIRKIPNLDDDN